MLKKLSDTIVAASTPRGLGGIGVVRISGDNALNLSLKVTNRKKLYPRKVQYSSFFCKSGMLIDVGLILYFKGPHSFTGEDVVECHVHGNDLILDSLIMRFIELGSRLAEPGEFSFRAYFNGKIDLLQAESINVLINSNLLFNNNFILKSLTGLFSKEINAILEDLLDLRQVVEACIEFPDDISFDEKFFFSRFNIIKNKFFLLFNKIYINHFISDCFKVVILGDVNVGKSSFFNLLLNKTRSIVSDIPGTTRDFIESDFRFDDLSFKLVDTAGFNHLSSCVIEKDGISSSYSQADEAAVLIFMFDASKISNPFLCPVFKDIFLKYKGEKKILIVNNKIDLCSIKEGFSSRKFYFEFNVSVKENKGIDLFLNEFKNMLFDIKDGSYMVSKRNYGLFINIQDVFLYTDKLLEGQFSFDIFAENLSKISLLLSNIIGKNVSNDILNSVFSNFCIGK